MALSTREQIGKLVKIVARMLFEDDGTSITAVEPEPGVSAGGYRAQGNAVGAVASISEGHFHYQESRP